jgi:hypothetical protein
LSGRIVWRGRGDGVPAVTDHPRNALRPWQPEKTTLNAERLRRGAHIGLGLFRGENKGDGREAIQPTGLMAWLLGQPLPFPLTLASTRLDAVRVALAHQDIRAFEAAAIRVLGLGPGLTPSGDDFVGGILFALHHAPLQAWRDDLPRVKSKLRAAAATVTNVISAALLDDLMDGASYHALHETLSALHTLDATKIEAAYALVSRLGASSGLDLLAGVLLALTSPQSPTLVSEPSP